MDLLQSPTHPHPVYGGMVQNTTDIQVYSFRILLTRYLVTSKAGTLLHCTYIFLIINSGNLHCTSLVGAHDSLGQRIMDLLYGLHMES